MKTIIVAIALSAVSLGAQAYCSGSDSYRYCTDNSGNSYTVQQYGNTTYTQGTNTELADLASACNRRLAQRLAA